MKGFFDYFYLPGFLKIRGDNTDCDAKIEPGNTLLIFDEIQQCPRALTSLKYFCEQANDYHIVAAGSLLGIQTRDQQGFPVGKVNFLQLMPLSFFEFLTAMGHSALRQDLEDIKHFEPLPEPLHDKCNRLLKQYFYIGGMPEAVDEYIKRDDYKTVREVQMDILRAYERDFSKHVPLEQIKKLIIIWNQLYQQLAKENKKFIFSAHLCCRELR